MHKKLILLPVLFAMAGPMHGCKSAYYGTMEAFGVHKRDILVDRVETARDKQEDAKEQFATALDEFRSVVEFEEGSDLEDMYKKLNSAVFPGGQGGPLMHVIAGKAVAFKEALEPEFKEYQARVVANAKAMVAEFLARGYNIVSGSTENHLFLVDLIDKDITGKEADAALGSANITVNKNSVPNDPRSPFVTSGIRIGSPSITRRGFSEADAKELAGWMCDILDNMGDESVIEATKAKVLEICKRLPVYA